MRRWACIVALLAGFTSDGFAWTVRPRIPVAIERPVEVRPPGPGMAPTRAWWQRP